MPTEKWALTYVIRFFGPCNAAGTDGVKRDADEIDATEGQVEALQRRDAAERADANAGLRATARRGEAR